MNIRNLKVAKWNKSYLIVIFLLFLLVVFISFSKPWNFNDDIWESGAAITEISIHPFHPDNPLLLLPGSTSPRFVPYTVFWGFVKRITGLNIFVLLGIIAIVNYLIFVRGLYLFVSTKFKDALLPVYTLLVMLVVWGTGFGWANEYYLGTFLESQTLTGFFAFALGLNSLYYLLLYLNNNSISSLIVYFVLSAIIFISHPITSIFLFVLAFSLILETKSLRKVLALQLVPLASFILSLFWPYFSYWNIFTKGSSEQWFITPVFSNQITALGFALLGIPIILWYFLKKQYLFLSYSLIICFLIYISSYLLNISIGGRFIIYSIFIMHLGISIYIKEINLFNFDTIKLSFNKQITEVLFIFLFLLYPVKKRFVELENYARNVFDFPFKFHSYDSPIKPYLFLTKYLSRSDVVLMDEGMGHLLLNKPAWPIPLLTGAKIVALEHYDPLLLDESKIRAQVVHEFFRTNLSLHKRQNILSKYKVTVILENTITQRFFDTSFINQLDSLGILVITHGQFKLYRVKGYTYSRL